MAREGLHSTGLTGRHITWGAQRELSAATVAQAATDRREATAAVSALSARVAIAAGTAGEKSCSDWWKSSTSTCSCSAPLTLIVGSISRQSMEAVDRWSGPTWAPRLPNAKASRKHCCQRARLGHSQESTQRTHAGRRGHAKQRRCRPCESIGVRGAAERCWAAMQCRWHSA
jgi:hypothetical protein